MKYSWFSCLREAGALTVSFPHPLQQFIKTLTVSALGWETGTALAQGSTSTCGRYRSHLHTLDAKLEKTGPKAILKITEQQSSQPHKVMRFFTTSFRKTEILRQKIRFLHIHETYILPQQETDKHLGQGMGAKIKELVGDLATSLKTVFFFPNGLIVRTSQLPIL